MKFRRKYNPYMDAGLRSILTEENGWYTGEKFTKILKRELKRTYRTESPLSFISIEILSLKQNPAPLPESDYKKFFNILIQIITDNTREFDIKYIDNEYIIDILLTETTILGAKIVTEKISGLLFRDNRVKNNDNCNTIVNSIKFSTYPLNPVSGDRKLEAKPIKVRDLEMKAESTKIPFQLLVNNKTKFYLDWNLAFTTQGTICIPISNVMGYSYDDFYAHFYKYAKRFIDIIGAISGLILFVPVLAIISIIIKLSSEGPILFRQKRLGYLGKQFTFLKFRTMSSNCDDQIHRDYIKKLIKGSDEDTNLGTEAKPLYKIQDDPRITKIGNILRKLSLDELPQLINVLNGDMSLVGPRPPIPYELDEYKYWQYRRVLDVKPGVTGLWQVHGRSMTTFDEMVRLDLQYINNQSIWLDIKIILKTFGAVLTTKGAM